MGNVFDRKDRGIREHRLSYGQGPAALRNQESLDKEKNCPLHIAVTGEHGSGKSTFVNAIRGLDNTDEGAAPTGSVGTTEDVRPYPHPNHPNVTFWDLPGIGTSKYPSAEFVELVRFERFDFFIIVSADRLRENDVKLAKEIQRMGKKFYFVRSKIDNNIRDKESRQREFDAERTLMLIRENCIQGLQEQGVRSPQIFLVSSFELHLYDFPLLADTLERELPDLRRDAFLFSMPNNSLEMIDRKKTAFHSKIKYFAALSAAVAAVPLPGFSVVVDFILLAAVVSQYVSGFGLNTSSLNKIASLATLMKKEEGYRFIPVFVIPVTMGLSFLTTHRALNICLNALASDAGRVFRKALS
ncbi:interferon-inducible GTPase 5-like [Xyrichtys novacula]|uniref:Interferon-inducible GTPase 5-like n=1 Tax=Xyrichtys novacula TaxID=13765 RepID=A0AAV1GLL4_XYRNO|nr:interferon-inducible GTPase 5-like [Xyrichtys novacula]